MNGLMNGASPPSIASGITVSSAPLAQAPAAAMDFGSHRVLHAMAEVLNYQGVMFAFACVSADVAGEKRNACHSAGAVEDRR